MLFRISLFIFGSKLSRVVFLISIEGVVSPTLILLSSKIFLIAESNQVIDNHHPSIFFY